MIEPMTQPSAPKVWSKNRKVCLVGNPNTGKSTLFNALCGARQLVGNYPGVTVEKKVGFATLANEKIAIIDLPGMYSLTSNSPDEAISERILLGEEASVGKPDLVVVVLDATNLKRNLFLLSQLIELGLPVIAAVTMADQLNARGISLDFEKLKQHLGIPVVGLSGHDAKGIETLKQAISQQLHAPTLPSPFTWPSPNLFRGMAAWQSAHKDKTTLYQLRKSLAGQPPAHALIREDIPFDFQEFIREFELDDEGPLETQHRYAWASKVVSEAEKRSSSSQRTFSGTLDRLLTHRLWGLFFFVGVMYFVFQSIYSWSGPLMDGIDSLFGGLGDLARPALASTPMLQSLVVDGMIGGVGSVVIFLPQIVILFAFVALMEDSGYLARVAFLMDKLMSWTGLNGRAFIPMLSGFACAIPAIMATRVMADAKARLITILVTPMMSCSARLPVYLLLIGTFIEPQFGTGWAVFTLFAMHALGLLLAIPIAWIFNKAFFKTQPQPFILEMPPYRVPKWRNVTFRSWSAGKKFLIQTGSIILALSIVVWALSYFPRPESLAAGIEQQFAEKAASQNVQALEPAARSEATAQMEQQKDIALTTAYLNQSYLARMGKTVQPLFAPLGFDWKITVGILAAFPAREVIVATLGIIFELGEIDENSPLLREKLVKDQHPDGRPVYTPLVAICLMLFFALCCQCMSTLATIKRELNSWKWPIFTFVYMTGLAYVLTLLVYQTGKALGWS